MQPHDAIALESLTRLLIRNLASTSELEASQTKHTQGQHIPKVLSHCQGWPPLLFITPRSNRAVTPSLGVFHSDRTRCTASDHPWPSTCPPGFNRDLSILQRSPRTNGHQATKRAAQLTGRATSRPITHSHAPASQRPDAPHDEPVATVPASGHFQ
jgi:hypothetical protein